MKKKSYAARLGALAVALTMMTASLMGGTLAKYTTEAIGTGTAIVAKWSIQGNPDIAKVEDKIVAKEVTLQETANTAVLNGKIAPGVDGTIPVYINLDGTEVATEVKVELIPEKNVDGSTNLPKNLVIKNTKGDVIGVNADGSYVIYDKSFKVADIPKDSIKEDIIWEWPFTTTSGDGTDTIDGETAATATFTVKVTATQLEADPSSQPN